MFYLEVLLTRYIVLYLLNLCHISFEFISCSIFHPLDRLDRLYIQDIYYIHLYIRYNSNIIV